MCGKDEIENRIQVFYGLCVWSKPCVEKQKREMNKESSSPCKIMEKFVLFPFLY